MAKKPDNPKGWLYADEPKRRRPPRGGRRSAPPGKPRLQLASDPKRRKEILLIIENWPLKQRLDWDSLMRVINARYHGDWTRQAVAIYEDLQEAFTQRREQIRQKNPKGVKAPRKTRTRDEQVVYLERQLAAANKDIVDLKVQLGIVENRMARWRHNALAHRMTIAQLDAPMQENDRGRSDRD